METKHGKHGTSAFFWGLIIGALFATLLSTKKGRLILREIVNLGLELIEDIVEEKRHKDATKVQNHAVSSTRDIEEAADDLESDIAEEERPSAGGQKASQPEKEAENEVFEAESATIEVNTEEPPATEKSTAETNGNGHNKKRLFRGLRRK